MSFHKQIIQYVDKAKGGQILLPTDFRGLGTDSAIKMSLSRICKEGQIVRLCHGVYLRSIKGGKNQNKEMDMHQVALIIAKKENVKICPSENYALFLLGLENQRPEVITFVTDGEPKRLTIHGKLLIFKSTTPRKLSAENPLVGLTIQSLEFLGKNNISAEILSKVKQKLQGIDQKVLVSDISKAPAWIYNQLFKLLININ
ncbi:DUF6088 family protein [Pedobacter nanyangensis]|uniref:DUF6088 family protein n=1 Tax=Pedobacter nanyangensis TaxID=1562389 RepID=UPI000DE346A7|nr:DUF6088 family protein [Pedobacter nanyangensis]